MANCGFIVLYLQSALFNALGGSYQKTRWMEDTLFLCYDTSCPCQETSMPKHLQAGSSSSGDHDAVSVSWDGQDFFDMNEHQPSHAQFLGILIPTLSAHPIPLCLCLKPAQSQYRSDLLRLKASSEGEWAEMRKMACARHPKAIAMCDPSWQETWKLSVLDVPLPSLREICSQQFTLTCKKRPWVSTRIILGKQLPNWSQ